MYRHHSWIYGLLNGTPFYEGIYPEAMHCFIYAMRVLFGVKIYSSQLFLAGIHVAVFLVSAYLLLKELFAWNGTAVLALALFLTVDLLCIDEIFSMSRLQWTLPQEFGLYTQFLCALFLLRCLKTDFSDRSGSRRDASVPEGGTKVPAASCPHPVRGRGTHAGPGSERPKAPGASSS
mgnify:FL=1